MALITSADRITAETETKKKEGINPRNQAQLNSVFNSRVPLKADRVGETKTATPPARDFFAASQNQVEEVHALLDSRLSENRQAENTAASILQASGKAEEKPAKKRTYEDSVSFSLPKGERQRFKIFCAQHDVKMSDYIYLAMDYIANCAEEGKLKVSRTGIKEIKKEYQ